MTTILLHSGQNVYIGRIAKDAANLWTKCSSTVVRLYACFLSDCPVTFICTYLVSVCQATTITMDLTPSSILPVRLIDKQEEQLEKAAGLLRYKMVKDQCEAKLCYISRRKYRVWSL